MRNDISTFESSMLNDVAAIEKTNIKNTNRQYKKYGHSVAKQNLVIFFVDLLFFVQKNYNIVKLLWFSPQ